jgi:hypothetical protein
MVYIALFHNIMYIRPNQSPRLVCRRLYETWEVLGLLHYIVDVSLFCYDSINTYATQACVLRASLMILL